MVKNNDLLTLIETAKRVLEGNWIGTSTKPAPALYPHQWNWDSGFIAVGYANYDQQRAQLELSTLFKSQWANGMLPQIVFNPDALGGYFPEPDFWQSERSPNAPSDVLTSGITMPPVHGIAARRILEKASDRKAAVDWLHVMWPKLLALHRYFYRERDPHHEGLVWIRHPWETGLDNSPTWDSPLQSFQVDKAALPPYERKDLKKGVPPEQRPSDEEYDKYVFLVDLFRRHAYDEKAIFEDCPFLVQDPLFNAILCKSNEDLVEIGQALGQDTREAEEWTLQTRQALSGKLWHADHRAFDAFDLHAGRKIEVQTSSGFMPLLCKAADDDQARAIYSQLESVSFCKMHDHSCFSIPNYDLYGVDFDADNYWRGPVWINTNWLLMNGLQRYGFHEKAASVREDIIELVRRWGFHEYFDPYEGIGYGTDNFSWTAALFIDTVLEAALEK